MKSGYHQPEVTTLEDAGESYDTPSSAQRPHAIAAFTLGKKTIVDINSGSTARTRTHSNGMKYFYSVVYVQIFDRGL